MEISNLLLCPICESDLCENGGLVKCLECSNVLQSENGITVLGNDDEYYWGEIPPGEMKIVLEFAKKKGWKKAIEGLVLKKHPDLRGMILGEDRIDWMNWVGNEKHIVLDVGSGWGQTSFLLARNKSNYIVSLEQIKQRALFQAIRKAEDRVDNIWIVNGSISNTKLINGIFDLILFIGVLEWVGVACELDNPREEQKAALRKVYDLLKDNALLCIGIENRIGFNNLLGAIDHSGLRFTSIMPRAIANAYVKVRAPSFRSNKSASSYRTYTYTAEGYRKLLAEVGFNDVLILIAHPHYAHPKCLIEMNNHAVREFFTNVYRPESIKDGIFSNLFRLLSLIGLGSILAPHFIIFARK